MNTTIASTNRPLVAEALLLPEHVQKLMTWLSPSFPVGAYTYSHGLEWAIEDGTVTSPAALEAWLADILRHGAGRTDAVLFCHAWCAAHTNDAGALASVAELGDAFQPSRERHLEATAQGRAFMLAVTATWPTPKLDALAAPFLGGAEMPYSVALALAAVAHDIPRQPALVAMLNAQVANIVSAGVRAIPIGQTDGQRIIASLSTVAADVAAAAEDQTLESLGGAALRADIASMKHETQYTRLFRA